MSEFEIIFYEKPDGTEPAKDFLLSVDTKMRARLVKIIELLSVNGTSLRKPYSEYLTDGIFEIRAKVGSDISRVLYFFIVGKKIILTNGFIKKTQKTPKNEIESAKKYRKDFLERNENQNDKL